MRFGMPQMDMQEEDMYIEVNNARLFVDINGAKSVPLGNTMVERPVLFLLHGGPGLDHTSFKPSLDELSEVAQLVYVDHRGNGRSQDTGPSTYNIAQMADDVEALRMVLGYQRIQVLGWSFGGFVALNYAVRYPANLEALIPLTTAANLDLPAEAWEIAAARATPEQIEKLPRLFEGAIETEEELADWWRVCLPLYFYRAPDGICDEILDRTQLRLEVTNYMMANELPKFNLVPQLGNISAPTLVISGRHDWVTPVSQGEVIASRIPGARQEVFEHSGHFPVIEEHGRCLSLLCDFVTSAHDKRIP